MFIILLIITKIQNIREIIEEKNCFLWPCGPCRISTSGVCTVRATYILVRTTPTWSFLIAFFKYQMK